MSFALSSTRRPLAGAPALLSRRCLAALASLGLAGTLALPCSAQIASPEEPQADDAAALVNNNPHMVGATVSAAQRNAQRRMLEQLRTSGLVPQQYEITISQDTLRRLRTSGVAADFNVCSLVSKSDQPGATNLLRGTRSNLSCNVNGLGN
jgi:hypothetical protein